MMSMQTHKRARRWSSVNMAWSGEQTDPNLGEDRDVLPSTASFESSAEQRDGSAVAKLLQTLSGETRLGRLVEMLMRLALKHGGAERGTLVLLRDDELRMEAQAVSIGQSIEVTPRRTAVTSVELPESILYAAIRTGQRVLLNDVQRSNGFANDEYVQVRRPRSVLCLPLLSQAELIGLLYLENNLPVGRF